MAVGCDEADEAKKKRHDEKSVKAVVFVIESRTTDSPLPVSVIVWSHRVILPFYRLLALLHYCCLAANGLFIVSVDVGVTL